MWLLIVVIVLQYYHSTQTEVIKMYCHTVIIQNITQCQCNNECGGSKFYHVNFTESQIKTVRNWSSVVWNYTDLPPQWVINIFEDNDLLQQSCKCQQYVLLGLNTYLTVYRLSLFSIFLFCQNLFQNFVELDPVDISFYTSAFFFPLYVPIFVFNIFVTYRFVKEKSSALMFQFIQSIAVSFTATFESDLLNVLLGDLFPNYFSIAHAFCTWNHLLALTLVSDRFLALTKPVLYKKYSSRKTAIKFSFILLLFSFLTQLPLVIVRENLSQPFVGYCYLSYSILLLVITICITTVMIKFLISVKKVTTHNDSQIRSHETNVSRLVFLSTIVDILPTLNVIIVFLSGGMYTINSSLITWYNIYVKSKVIYGILLPLSPLVSIIVCSIFSQFYRQKLKCLFCCSRCKMFHSNSVVPNL